MIENTNPRTMHRVAFASVEALHAHFSTYATFLHINHIGSQWDVWATRTGADGRTRPMILATYRQR